MTAVGYAYPWDFAGDPGAAERMRAVGVDAVAVAANYHGVRAGTPNHPDRRIVVAPHAACYLPVRAAAWSGQRLVPRSADSLDTADPFGDARAALGAAGLGVHAWTVLTHNSALGREHSDLVVHNAFGEPYQHALCPSAPEVVDYCATLVGEVVTVGEPDGIILEACGPLGVDHGGAHDKLAFADWSATRKRLLSLCFCAACGAAYRAAGLDPERIAALVRDLLAADGVDPELPEDVAAAVLAVRAAAVAELRGRVVGRIRECAPTIRVTLHAAADPWAVGAFPALGADSSTVDCVVGNCWAGPETGVAELTKLSVLAGNGVAVGGYVRPDTVRPDPVGQAARYLAAGLTELHLYHLGLVPQPALDVFRDLVAAARRAEHPSSAPVSPVPTTPR